MGLDPAAGASSGSVLLLVLCCFWCCAASGAACSSAPPGSIVLHVLQTNMLLAMYDNVTPVPHPLTRYFQFLGKTLGSSNLCKISQ